MSKTEIHIMYESRLGTKFYARMEALDFDQIFGMIQKFSEWCDENGFPMKHIEINYYEAKETEI